VVGVPRAFVRRPPDRDARLPCRSTRRALLLAGGASLLAGCGKDDAERAAVPATADALRSQLAAERDLVARLALLPELAPRRDRRLVGDLSVRARRRAQILAAELSAAGGRPHDVPQPPAAKPSVDAALDGARGALTAHVTALPSMAGRARRGLAADLVAESAADLALLGDVFGAPSEGAFPGTPDGTGRAA
jgi:hypothetical protein